MSSRHNRNGFTLMELMVSIGVLLLILEAGGTMLSDLNRAARVSGQPSIVIDRVCDRLRRELTASARIDGGDLITSQARWQVDGKALLRDRKIVCQVETATWKVDGGIVSVRLQPIGLPAREIISCP